MYKKLALSLSTVFVVACNPVTGTLSVKENLKLLIPESENCNDQIDWWNCNNSPETVLLQPGTYSLKLNFKSSKAVDIEVKTKSNTTKTIPIEMKNGQSFPEYNGRVSLKGSDIGQNFDLVGDVDSVITESETYREYERCSEQVKRRVCERVYNEEKISRRNDKDGRDHEDRNRRDRDDRRGGGRDQVKCETKYVTEYGDRFVEYYYRYTDTKVDLDFLNVKNGELQANYEGTRVESSKIYTYKGACLIH
ncbi:MAG: hypothetical protein KDD58_07430 [Bdellovibrionales bacterium]|nr:hypothetical protein [Bdellovibrionales bacterium]